MSGANGCVFRIGIDSRADGSRSHIGFEKQQAVLGQSVYFFFQRGGKRVKFLSQRHGNGILQLRAPHFNDLGKRCSFFFESDNQFFHCLDQFADAAVYGYFQRGRVSIVGGL